MSINKDIANWKLNQATYDYTKLNYELNQRTNSYRNYIFDQNIIKRKESSNNIDFKSSCVLDDILTLTSCKNLVFSMGTFCLLPYLISSHIKRVYITSFMINKPRGKNWYKINENKNNVLIPFEKYMKAGSWKNKPEQVELMLNYKMDTKLYDKFKI